MLFAATIDWPAFFGALTPLLVLLHGIISKRDAIKSREVTNKVKEDLIQKDAEKLKKIDKVQETNNEQNVKLDTIQKVINGRHTAALEKLADALEKIAKRSKAKKDVQAAKEARADALAHKDSQLKEQ